MIQVETILIPMSNSTRRTSVARLPPWPTHPLRSGAERQSWITGLGSRDRQAGGELYNSIVSLSDV